VLVKTLDGYGIPDAFRVTVGRPEDNERFVEALWDALAARREPWDAGRS
jgi:histidinol-phosphate/aromatic aminotransferase/cobyric acid decarboxylase-like protein